MSFLSIQYAAQLINNIRVPSEQLAMIQAFNKPIYIIVDDFSQQDIDKHSTVLNAGIEDKWISDTVTPNVEIKVVSPASPIDILKVCVSPWLSLTTTIQQPVAARPR